MVSNAKAEGPWGPQWWVTGRRWPHTGAVTVHGHTRHFTRVTKRHASQKRYRPKPLPLPHLHPQAPQAPFRMTPGYPTPPRSLMPAHSPRGHPERPLSLPTVLQGSDITRPEDPSRGSLKGPCACPLSRPPIPVPGPLSLPPSPSLGPCPCPLAQAWATFILYWTTSRDPLAAVENCGGLGGQSRHTALSPWERGSPSDRPPASLWPRNGHGTRVGSMGLPCLGSSDGGRDPLGDPGPLQPVLRSPPGTVPLPAQPRASLLSDLGPRTPDPGPRTSSVSGTPSGHPAADSPRAPRPAGARPAPTPRQTGPRPRPGPPSTIHR